MKMYPAMRATMGSWPYYIVRMTMREISREVDLAEDLFEDNQLREHMQRDVGGKRVEDIVNYLLDQEDRFFPSIVVAAIGGEPEWHPVESVDSLETTTVFSQLFRDSVGALVFVGEPKYYVLDGQHRVSAIGQLVRGDAHRRSESEFGDEVLSVIVVLPEDLGPGRSWRQRYRRLFTSLNRWAKPTDKDTNIVMDEDDRFAVLTRRLISRHPCFSAAGREKESYRVLTQGKALKQGGSHFTSLQVLYDLNRRLLTSERRLQQGWPPPGRSRDPFLQKRPSEDDLDAHYDELKACWDALFRLFPDLGADPREMRDHSGESRDDLRFWPIGQEVFAAVVRGVLDRLKFDPAEHAEDEASDALVEALRPLTSVDWDLHSPPWRFLLLTGPHEDGKSRWRMRSEDRKQAMVVAERLILWMAGWLDTPEAEIRADWQDLLYPRPSDEEVERCWAATAARRRKATAG